VSWPLGQVGSKSKRSGEVKGCGYPWGEQQFETAIADFSTRYADQNQRDYDTFVKAIAVGRIQAVTGIWPKNVRAGLHPVRVMRARSVGCTMAAGTGTTRAF
jgi:hypothetical protein